MGATERGTLPPELERTVDAVVINAGTGGTALEIARSRPRELTCEHQSTPAAGDRCSRCTLPSAFNVKVGRSSNSCPSRDHALTRLHLVVTIDYRP